MEAGHIKRPSKTDPKHPTQTSSVARRGTSARGGLSRQSGAPELNDMDEEDVDEEARPESASRSRNERAAAPRETSKRQALERPSNRRSRSGEAEVLHEVAHHAISHGRSRRLSAIENSAVDGDSGPPQTPPIRRRARKRIRATTILFVLVAAVFSLSLMAMTHVVWAEYRLYQGEVDRKEATLHDLHEQLETGRKRLAVLQSPKGREQMLIEHGYIRPGDRILLFPPTPEERQAAAIPKNDLSSRPAARINDGTQSSAWRRAGETLRGWWQNFNAPATTPKAPLDNLTGEASASD